MTRKILYSLSIPSDAQTMTRKDLRRNVSKEGVMSGGSAGVESVSVQPGDRILQGEYRGDMADLMAREVEQLFGCDGIEYVPMFGLDPDGNRVSTDFDGYYSLEDVSTNPPDPRNETRGHYKFDGSLAEKGTKQDYWRAVSTAPKEVANPFGSDSTAYIGVPAAASKIRWYDAKGGTAAREAATVVATRTSEFVDIDIVDATSTTFDDPMLIYEIPYEDEAYCDPGVWDKIESSRDRTRTVNGQEVCQWQRVFDTRHEYSAFPLIDNGLLRFQLAEGSIEYAFAQWDPSGESWGPLNPGDSNWELFDADIFYIGDEKVRAQCEFVSGDGSTFYSLNMAIRRGYNLPQWTIPPNESDSVPSGLQTLLDPVANSSEWSPDETKTLMAREEVRR